MKKTFIILIIVVFSCQQNKIEKEIKVKSVTETIEPLNSNQKKYNDYNYIRKLRIGVNNNNLESYRELSNIYLSSDHQEELLFFAIKYGLKNNDAYACKEVYNTLSRDKDKDIQHIANFFLLKAYENGYENLDIRLKEKFGDTIPKSYNYFNNKIE